MAKTGESYSSARRQIIAQPSAFPQQRKYPHHFPGSIPAAAALRALLSHAGVRNPRTRAPFSEAMAFGIAGGIGAGMFTFHYAKENFSSFYVAGRHLWQDHVAWVQGALNRLGAKAVIKESSGVKPAEKQLREMLEGGRPVMAWVEGYRVIAIHGVDDATGAALVGDQSDDPTPLPLPALAEIRGRVKSYKNRLLALEPAGKTPDLAPLIKASISACADGLVKGRMKNFTLEVFATWADRLDGSKAADSWEKLFPPGPLLYRGLSSIAEYVEHSGTGGGLCRPMFAEFLEEAAIALNDKKLELLAGRYRELSSQWTALADAALPENVPVFREAKERLGRRSELLANGDPVAVAELRECSNEADLWATRMKNEFPLDGPASTALRRDLKRRVAALYQAEKEAVGMLQDWG
jgi:hypothetical protein